MLVLWCGVAKRCCVVRNVFVGLDKTCQKERVVTSWDNPEAVWRVWWWVRWSPFFGPTC
jgi:hypothetical protein